MCQQTDYRMSNGTNIPFKLPVCYERYYQDAVFEVIIA